MRELHENLATETEITLWLPDYGLEKKLHVEGVEINSIRVPNLRLIRSFLFDIIVTIKLFLILIFKNKTVDSVYLRQSYSTVLVSLAPFIFKKKFFVEVNGFFDWDLKSRGAGKLLRLISRIGEKLSYKAANKIICVTQGIKNNIDSTFNNVIKKTVVIRNGVDVSKFMPLDKANARKVLGFENELTIGYVGCFTPWDGIERIIEILPGLIEKFSNLKVVLVGKGHCIEDVKSKVKELNVEKHVIFTGFVKNERLSPFIASFDIALAPYITGRNEMGVSSLKCLEYFSVGVPVVLGRVPEMEYIEESGGGKIIDSNEQLFESIANLLSDPAGLLLMGKKAREYVVNNATWKSASNKTLKEMLR